MDTWAHSNTLRLRNSPRKAMARGSATREEQRLRPQPWARRGGQPALRTPCEEEGAWKHQGLLCLTRPPSGPQGKRQRGDRTAQHTHLVRSPLHGLQQQPLLFPVCRRFVLHTDQGHPVQRGVAPGTLGGAGRGGAACRPCALLRGSGSPPPILVSVCTQVGF